MVRGSSNCHRKTFQGLMTHYIEISKGQVKELS
jgi:hypothetical protein